VHLTLTLQNEGVKLKVISPKEEELAGMQKVNRLPREKLIERIPQKSFKSQNRNLFC
jgi:hypothetical protein